MGRETKTIGILGTKWTIAKKLTSEDPLFRVRGGAYYDNNKKRIVVCWDAVDDDGNVMDNERYKHFIKREIIRAFFHESGIWCMDNYDYYTIAEWFAFQHDKIHAAFVQAGAVESDATEMVNAMTRLSSLLNRLEQTEGEADGADKEK